MQWETVPDWIYKDALLPGPGTIVITIIESQKEMVDIMRRKLFIICIALVMVFGMSASAFAASGYNAVSKLTYTYYEQDGDNDGAMKALYSGNIWYKYNKKKDLTKVVYDKSGSDYIQHTYKYKNGRKKSMTIKGGSWDGTKVYYNKKGRRSRIGDAVYSYNSKGYVSAIKHRTPWEIDGRYRETWTYTYSGSKLKTAYHKVMKKNGGILETDSYTFNNKGLPSEWIHTYGEASENSGITERFTYTYKYKNNKVKSVTKNIFSINEDDGTYSLWKQEKYAFTYSKKKISASRYRMMVFDLIRLDENYYNYCLPGSWF